MRGVQEQSCSGIGVSYQGVGSHIIPGTGVTQGWGDCHIEYWTTQTGGSQMEYEADDRLDTCLSPYDCHTRVTREGERDRETGGQERDRVERKRERNRVAANKCR